MLGGQSLTGSIAQFLRSPQLEDFCGQFGASTLAEVHRSLSNKSKIGACVQQARLFFYPEGQDLNGVVFLQNTNPLIKVSACLVPLN